MAGRKGTVKVRGNSIQFSFYYKGERIRATLPLMPNKSHIETAENMMSAIQYDIALDKFNLAKYFPDHPLVKRFQVASQIKISDQLDIWVKHKQDLLALSTLRDYRSAINFHLTPIFGDFTISELTTTHVRN